MGKTQHGKDKMYITAKEHAESAAGVNGGRGSGGGGGGGTKRLPFDCCALTLTPWEHPVATRDGFVFDLSAIVPFLRRHGVHPVTGAPLAGKDLIKLTVHRNADGRLACPVTGKVFTEHSRIAMVCTSGNVYAMEALETLCFAPKNFRDLLTDEPFKRDDVVLLQDPTSEAWLKAHDTSAFYHRRMPAGGSGGGAGGGSGGTGSSSGAAGGVMLGRSAVPAPVGGSGVVHANDATRRVLEDVAARGGAVGAAAAAAGMKRSRDDAGLRPEGVHATGAGERTTGRMAASFTSSGVSVVTRNEVAPETAEERRARRWRAVAAGGKKALVRIVTTRGNLNCELAADLAPRTVDNFLTLARAGAYNGPIFHRLIRNFMVQGGDPTGTGTGGASAWGAPFRDEFHPKLTHGERGVLSMANSGPDSNRSQFFITFKSAPHLDRKHSVFGRVVGGLEVLRDIETAPVDAKDRPTEDIRILEVRH